MIFEYYCSISFTFDHELVLSYHWYYCLLCKLISIIIFFFILIMKIKFNTQSAITADARINQNGNDCYITNSTL